jgi:hypothetical protein
LTRGETARGEREKSEKKKKWKVENSENRKLL